MKKLFRELYKQSIQIFKKQNFWDSKLDISNSKNHPYIELYLTTIQRSFQTDSMDLYLAFEKAFLQDIVELKKKYPDSIEILNYLQLSTFTNSAGYFNIKGLFTYSYDSIVLSLRDSKIGNGDELVIECERFWRFLNSPNSHIVANSEAVLIEWLLHLYYCSYSSGSFFRFGNDLWNVATHFAIDSKNFTHEKFRLLSNLIAWNANYKKDTEFNCSDFLIEEFKKLTWDNYLKIDICSQIILLNGVDNSIRTAYFQELSKEIVLEGHTELQLLISITGHIDDYDKNHTQLLDAVKKYNDFLESKITSKVLFVSERARIFKILNNLIILLGKVGKSFELTKILGAYYDVKCELDDSILFAFPYFEEGMLYFNNDNCILKKQDTFKLSQELITLSNQLFNRTIALIGDSTDLYIPKKEMGIPSGDYSQEFEQKAFELYNFNLIKEHFNKDINGILQLGFNSIPIQALMLKQIGFSYPIINSFSKSYKENKLETILIWTSGSYTSYFEQSALTYLCDKYSVKYELTKEEEIDKKIFIEKYVDEKYSILWIASHGEHNNYEPHKSIINISPNDSISMEELISCTLNFNSNRLLVLNLCESGINSEAGGFKGFGFGHQLVSCNQSIISHLWMVEPRIAMSFGICLAIGLIAKKMNYFDSYCFAVRTLIMGKEYTIKEMKSELGELEDVIERIENVDSIDWSNILNWGSSVMYK